MNEVVLVSGVRTAVGAFGKALRSVQANELAQHVLEGLVRNADVSKADVDEIIFGHGYVHGGGLNSARIASQRAGFPKEVPAYVVIKACGSSLKAITNGAAAIASGQDDTIIAGGTESMSNVPYLVKNRWGAKFGNIELEDALLADGLTCSLGNEHMGITAERLAHKYNISREEQDQFAFQSHCKAINALESGKLQEEIFPLKIKTKEKMAIFSTDESVRHDINMESLRKLSPVFKEDGLITAGNACPMNDGAAAVLMMSNKKAEAKGLKPLIKIKAYVSTGVDHAIMGIGPVTATLKALKKAKLSIEDIGLFELNEAFAAQAIAVIKELQLPPERVNVNGGAIALGHPVGATGAKLTVSLMHEMIRSETRFGLVTMCMAGGMGICVIYENMTV
ncbi:thiolase family protein [Virgibacillus sp. W0430]|uniref:thiolase family protein n=1 Tax=Virgibacillus sp. W0430 TaxID=3391580 RepID=UPI003F473D36